MDSPSSFIRPENFWRSLGLKAGQKVVHLGCGAGYYLVPAAKIVGPSGSVTGVDIRSEILAEAESKANRQQVGKIVRTVRGNLEEERGSKQEDASADWVLFANVLHQSDPLKVLTEAARIVNASGSIVVIDWDTASTPFGPPRQHRLGQLDAQRIATQLKLAIKHHFSPSPYHWGLILGKA